MQWYKIHIPRAEIAKGKHKEIHKLVGDILLFNPSVIKGTLLVSSRHITDNYYLYFSVIPTRAPIVREIIDIYDAVACSPPLKNDVSFIGGDSSAWKTLE